MGISGLLPFLKNASRPVHVREFKGSTVAVDVYCWLHKAGFGCAEQLAQGKPTDAYVKYIMKYVDLLLYHDIKPILVFDGRNLPSKAETEKKRRENRKMNRERAVQLLAEGKAKEAREYFQRCVDVTPHMARTVINACRDRNIDCIVAPYEADAQLAYLATTVADFVITEDSDLTLFGCEKIIFKLSPAGDGILYEKNRLNEVFGNLAPQFDFEKFRKMCIMSGCDYLQNLHGVGLGKSKQFWSKITNPNVKAVLPKIPHYLKLPSLTVPQSYIDGFVQATNTFLYQVIFDPLTRKERPLNDYGVDIVPDTLSYCGKFTDQHTALQLALGNLDLHSLKKMSNFDPDNCPRLTESKYGSVAKHSSIWTPGYTKQNSHTTTNTMNNAAFENSKAKQVTVNTSFVNGKSKQVTASFPGIAKAYERSVEMKRKLLSTDKRKIESLMTEEEVQQMLNSQDVPSVEEDTSQSPTNVQQNKKIRLSSSLSEEKAKIDSRFTRVLGDSKIEGSNNTVSRYFGNSGNTNDCAKAKASAGNWFQSINSPSDPSPKFIYDTDRTEVDTGKQCKKGDGKDMMEESHTILSDISNSPEPIKTLKAFERAPSRNPFAVKKPLFDDKEIGSSQEMTKLKVKVASSLPNEDKNEKCVKTAEENSLTRIVSATSTILSSSSHSSPHSSLLMNKSVRPSGLSKPRGKPAFKIGKPGPNQPTLTSLFARQEKRANL